MLVCNWCGKELKMNAVAYNNRVFCDDVCKESFVAMQEEIKPVQKVAGVGPEQPIVTNEKGGKQAKNDYAFHLIDYDALFQLAKVMGEGAKKYEKDNWRLIPSEEHFDHGMAHWLACMAGDKQDNHAGHFITRAVMWYATAKAEGKI